MQFEKHNTKNDFFALSAKMRLQEIKIFANYASILSPREVNKVTLFNEETFFDSDLDYFSSDFDERVLNLKENTKIIESNLYCGLI